MSDTEVAADEARRIAQHAAVKRQIEGNVNAEIREQARTATVEQAQAVGHVAEELRGRALSETVASEHERARARRAARISQFVDYLFYLLYAFLAIRFVLALIGARSTSGFVQFINGATSPFYAPFRGIVSSPSVEGGFVFALPVLIAIAAYTLLHLAINGILKMAVHRKTTI